MPVGGVLNDVDGFFENNRAHGMVGGGEGGHASGGALYCGGTCNLTRARVTGNRAGDPNVDLGTAPAVGIDAFGGAVYVALAGQFSALNSFFRDSVANGGLGLTTSGRAEGGAIYSASVDAHCDFCTVINSSVMDATPPAAVPSSVPSLDFVRVRNSIVAFSTINGDPTDRTCAAASGGASFESYGGNLYSTEAAKLACGSVTTDSVGEIGVDDHRYLSPTSAALSAAQDCKTWAGTTVTDDILRIDRPHGPKCESGAKERPPTDIALTLSGPASVLTPTTAGATLDLSTTLDASGNDGAGVSVTYVLPSGVTFASATGMTCTGTSTLVCYIGAVYYVAPPGTPATVGLKLNVANRTTPVIIDATSSAESGDTNASNNSGSVTVAVKYCGDGQTTAPELCDDGGNAPGDGCDASCMTESGWECSGTPSQCVGYDYGDAPSAYELGDPARHASRWIYLGAGLPDVELGPYGSPDAAGDGADDDGAVLPTSFVRGGQFVTFKLRKTVDAPAGEQTCVAAWVDLQGDHAFDPLADRVFLAAQGTDFLPQDLEGPVVIPTAAKSGTTFLRVRYMRGDCVGIMPTGLEDAGEVEDYRITIENSCGDGNKDGDEACDDGDFDDGDGCSSSCTVEDGWQCSGALPTTCVHAVDLAVGVSTPDSVLELGQDVPVTVTVQNLSSANATGVEVTVVLPVGLDFSSANTFVGSYAPGTGVWNIGALAAGASVTLTVNATVAGDQMGRSMTLTASVTEVVQTDTVASNDSATLSLHTPYAIGASGVNIDFGGFMGSGFSAYSAPGQLSSFNWALVGYGTDLAFGGTSTDPSLARGVSDGGATEGGVYASMTAAGNPALGIQPTGDVGTPGFITLRLENTTGATLQRVRLSYRLAHFNDGAVRDQVNLSYSTDGISFTSRSEKFWQSEPDATVPPVWVGTDRVGVVDGLGLAEGGFLYVRWSTDENFGVGPHDEIALDDITVTPLDPTASDTIYYTQFTGGTGLVPFGIIRSDGVQQPIGAGLDFGADENRQIKLIPTQQGHFVAYNVGGNDSNGWGIVSPETGVFTRKGDLNDTFELMFGDAPVIGVDNSGVVYGFGFVGSSKYKFGRFDMNTGAFVAILADAPPDFASSFAPARGAGLYYAQETGGTGLVPFGRVNTTTGAQTPIGGGLDFLDDSDRYIEFVTRPDGTLFAFDLPSFGGGGPRRWGTIDPSAGVFTPIGDLAAEFDLGFGDAPALGFTASGRLLVHGFIGSSTYKLGTLSTTTGAFSPVELPSPFDYAYAFAAPPTIACGDVDDDNPCTDDACDPATGVITRTNNTNTCDDATVCNGREVCGGGTCNAGTPLVVDDGNPCTTDSACDPVTGVTRTNNTNTCDDATVCNGREVCGGGTCNAGTPLVVDDGDGCTTDACNPTTGAITHAAVVINDNDACTTDACNPATGVVTHVAIATDDNDACTIDACNPTTGAVTHVAVEIDDGNACTIDSCVPTTGVAHTPVAIDDNNACTADACNPATGVTHTAIVVNDNNACTTDTCNTATGAVHTALVCDDGNACTTDACNRNTGCTATPIACGDSNACTTDSCDPATGCVNAAVDCNDDNACTTDTCSAANGCSHANVSCDDGDPCTADACDPADGCVHTPTTCNQDPCARLADNTPCDGGACALAAACSGGVCVATRALVCDDDDACTTDTCDPLEGCLSVPVGNGTPCDDDNACTDDDACSAGTCTGTATTCEAREPCETAGVCNPATGVCDYQVDALCAACQDDAVKPTIVCPTPVAAAQCTFGGTRVTLGGASANDACSATTVTNNAPATYEPGVTTVTFTATDLAGNTASCTTTVEVVDTLKPTVECPEPITVAGAADTCGADGRGPGERGRRVRRQRRDDHRARGDVLRAGSDAGHRDRHGRRRQPGDLRDVGDRDRARRVRDPLRGRPHADRAGRYLRLVRAAQRPARRRLPGRQRGDERCPHLPDRHDQRGVLGDARPRLGDRGVHHAPHRGRRDRPDHRVRHGRGQGRPRRALHADRH